MSHFLCTLPLLQSCHARRFGLQNPDLLPVLATPTGTPALPPEPSWVAAAPPAIASCARRALHALHTSRLALADVIYRTESKSTEARQQINEVAKGAERVSEAGEPKPSRKGDNVVANEGCESPGPAPEAAANPGVVARRECARAVLASLETEGTRAMGRLRQVAEEAAGDLEAVKETEAGTFELLDSWIAERIKVSQSADVILQAPKKAAGTFP